MCRNFGLAMGVLLGSLGVFYFSFLCGGSYLWEDLLYMAYPFQNHLATSLASGHFPLWLCGQRDGLPFFCESWVYYPPLWCLSLFVVDGHLPSLVIQWYCVGQLFLAGLFAYLFLAGHKLDVSARIVGMVVFVFSGFLSLTIVNGAMEHAFLWLPLELYFVKKVVERDRTCQNYIFLIFSVAMSYLAGFPQYVLYNGYLMGLYWLFLYWRREGSAINRMSVRKSVELVREGALIAGVFVVVGLLCLFSILATMQGWSQSARQEFGFSQIADESMPWYYLIHGVIPNFFGMSNGDGSGIPYWGFNKDSQAFRIWHGGYWMYFEFGFYAGQLALVSLVVALLNVRRLWRNRPEAVFFLGVVAPMILFMLGRYGGLFTLCYHVLPGISMFRVPTRMGALLDFSLAALTALVVGMLVEAKVALNVKKPLLIMSGLYAAFLVWFFAFGDAVFPEVTDPVRYAHALGETVKSILIFSAIASVVFFMSKTERKSFKTLGATALVLLAFIDLYLAFHHFHQGTVKPEQYYADRNGLISRMAQLREQDGPFRFAQLRDGNLSEEVIFPRNSGYLYPAYEAVEGYVMFNMKGYLLFNNMTNQKARMDIQNIGVVANADRSTGRVSLARYTNSLPRAKFYHDVRAYDKDESLLADLDAGHLDYHHTLGALKDDCVKYGIPTSAPPAKAEIHFQPINSDSYQISYQTTAPGVIFVSESDYPGWLADGGLYPIIRVFGAFKGIVVSKAGSGVITVRFMPQFFFVALFVSLATFGLLLAVLAVISVRSKKGLRP